MNFRNLNNQSTQKLSSVFLHQFRRAFILFLFIGFSMQQSEAQVLKRLGKKIEQKIDQRVERKTDRAIDKALDKTESEAGKAFENNPENSKEAAVKEKSSTEKPSTASIKDGVIMVSSDCSDFIWFKKGAKMKFEELDGKGKSVSQSQMLITDVKTVAGNTIADAKFSDNKKNEFEMQYKCANGKLYMDFSSALKEAMAKAGGDKGQSAEAVKNMEMGFSDGFMTFPSSMYPGQNLDDAVFTMKTTSSNMSMDVTSSLSNRKVVAKEKVTTPAGTFDCLKITGTRTTTMNMLGTTRNMGKPTQEHIWMAPGIGNIKQEVYNDKGKLESKNQLIEFKM